MLLSFLSITVFIVPPHTQLNSSALEPDSYVPYQNKFANTYLYVCSQNIIFYDYFTSTFYDSKLHWVYSKSMEPFGILRIPLKSKVYLCFGHLIVFRIRVNKNIVDLQRR